MERTKSEKRVLNRTQDGELPETSKPKTKRNRNKRTKAIETLNPKTFLFKYLP